MTLEYFNCRDIYNKEIVPLIEKVTILLDAKELPYLISTCPENGDKGALLHTVYTGYEFRFCATLARAASLLTNKKPVLSGPEPDKEYYCEQYYDVEIWSILIEIEKLCKKYEIPYFSCVLYEFNFQNGFGVAYSSLGFKNRFIPPFAMAKVLLVGNPSLDVNIPPASVTYH